MFRASLGGEHTENTGPTSNVQNSLIFKKMTIVDDCCPVGTGSDRVLQHLLVDTCITADQSETILESRYERVLTEMRVRIGIAEVQKKRSRFRSLLQHTTLGIPWQRCTN